MPAAVLSVFIAVGQLLLPPLTVVSDARLIVARMIGLKRVSVRVHASGSHTPLRSVARTVAHCLVRLRYLFLGPVHRVLPGPGIRNLSIAGMVTRLCVLHNLSRLRALWGVLISGLVR